MANKKLTEEAALVKDGTEMLGKCQDNGPPHRQQHSQVEFPLQLNCLLPVSEYSKCQWQYHVSQ